MGGESREALLPPPPRRECDLLISGRSVLYRLAIIDRWRELEAAEARATIVSDRPDKTAEPKGTPAPFPSIVPPDPAPAALPASPAAQADLAIFDSPEFGAIWTVIENRKPLFCARDAATALGYSRPADAVTSHCKGVVVLPTPSPGGVQMMKWIPESDVYRLVIRSKLPGAERFQDWVVEEVLPALRETGRFEVAPVFPIPQTLGDALRLAADLADQNAAQARRPDTPKGAVAGIKAQSTSRRRSAFDEDVL